MDRFNLYYHSYNFQLGEYHSEYIESIYADNSLAGIKQGLLTVNIDHDSFCTLLQLDNEQYELSGNCYDYILIKKIQLAEDKRQACLAEE